MKKMIQEDAKEIAGSDLPWEKLEGKTILITGASGYVPAYFVYVLMERNKQYDSEIKVIALCRNEEKAREIFGDYLEREDFVLLIQDVCEPLKTQENINYIIHAASPAGILERHRLPVNTFSANVLGCYNMFELCRKNQVDGFLLISSVDAYGSVPSNTRLEETQVGLLDPLEIRNVYSNAKRACETLCICEAVQNSIPVTIARPFQILGPGIALDDGRLHIDFISQMMDGDKIVLKGDGTAKRTFMYITDAIRGLLYIMLLGRPGEVYNVVDEKGEATVLELAKLMASQVTDREIAVVFDITKRNNPEVKHAPSCVTGTADKLRELGWNSCITLEEGTKRLINYYLYT